MVEKIIFGGTFDPWTPAHEQIVRQLLEQYPNAGEILIVPSTVSWHREGKTPMFDPSDRLDIINRRLGANRWGLKVRVADFEYTFAAHHPTIKSRGFIDTLMYLETRWMTWYKGATDIKFVVGADEWRMFPKWKDSAEILKMAKPIVVTRGGERLPTGVDLLVLDDRFSAVSASAIRKTLAGKKPPTPDEYCSDGRIWAVDLTPPTCLLETEIFKVMSVPGGMPNFRPVQVRAPDWVCVMVEDGGTFKCVRQRRWGTGEEYDEFVTGAVDEGEGPVDAACRELQEELGLKVEPAGMVPLGSVPTNPGFMNNRMHYFYVDLKKAAHTKCKPKPDEHERLAPVDVTMEDLYYRKGRPALMLAGLALLAEHLERQQEGGRE